MKDFGTVIAGHGGVLDRLDSVCFSAPCILPCSPLFLRALTYSGLDTPI